MTENDKKMTTSEEGEIKRISAVCDELERITQEQSTAIENADIDLLTDLLGQRDKLISALDVQSLLNLTDAAGGREIKQRLGDVLRMDEANRIALSRSLDALRQQIRDLGQGRQALHGYSIAGPFNEPSFLDKRR